MYKNFTFSYTGTKNECFYSVKCKDLHYYLEEIRSKRFEQFLNADFVLVINWVIKADCQKNKNMKRPVIAEILELYKMCVNFKKTSGRGLQLTEMARINWF